MAKISNKKLKEISRISFVDVLLKQFEGRVIAGTHWVDTPPDMWSQDETNRYDMMNELEMKLKAEILKVFGVDE